MTAGSPNDTSLELGEGWGNRQRGVGTTGFGPQRRAGRSPSLHRVRHQADHERANGGIADGLLRTGDSHKGGVDKAGLLMEEIQGQTSGALESRQFATDPRDTPGPSQRSCL